MRTVLLRHTLPDGTEHYDWLTQPAPEAPLVAFRVIERIDLPACVAFTAQRIPDHRPVYLDYEGEVSGGRGHVTRVATGTAVLTLGTDTATLTLNFGPAPRAATGTRQSADLWSFTFVPARNMA